MFQDEESIVIKHLNSVLYKPILECVGGEFQRRKFSLNNRISGPTDCDFLKKDFIYLLLRREGREKEKEININV